MSMNSHFHLTAIRFSAAVPMAQSFFGIWRTSLTKTSKRSDRTYKTTFTKKEIQSMKKIGLFFIALLLIVGFLPMEALHKITHNGTYPKARKHASEKGH